MTHKERIHLEVLFEDVVNATVAETKAEDQRRRAEAKLKDYLRTLEKEDAA